jgi:hypothetical protein
MLNADHTLIVFIPGSTSSTGFFYDFNSLDLFSFDLGETIFADLAHHTWANVSG